MSLRCDHAFFLEKLAIIKCCLWLPESVARHEIVVGTKFVDQRRREIVVHMLCQYDPQSGLLFPFEQFRKFHSGVRRKGTCMHVCVKHVFSNRRAAVLVSRLRVVDCHFILASLRAASCRFTPAALCVYIPL